MRKAINLSQGEIVVVLRRDKIEPRFVKRETASSAAVVTISVQENLPPVFFSFCHFVVSLLAIPHPGMGMVPIYVAEPFSHKPVD